MRSVRLLTIKQQKLMDLILQGTHDIPSLARKIVAPFSSFEKKLEGSDQVMLLSRETVLLSMVSLLSKKGYVVLRRARQWEVRPTELGANIFLQAFESDNVRV